MNVYYINDKKEVCRFFYARILDNRVIESKLEHAFKNNVPAWSGKHSDKIPVAGCNESIIDRGCDEVLESICIFFKDKVCPK